MGRQTYCGTLATERILHADKVAELTFESTDSGSFFVAASEKLGYAIDIRETIPASEETFVHYASVRGGSVDTLREIAEAADCVVQMREIQRTEEQPGGDVEIELHGQSLAHTLVTEDAVVTTDRVIDGRAEVVCEVPAGSDISSLVTCVKDSFPETTLVSKRELSSSADSEEGTASRMLEDVFKDELTDRQQEILRAAVYGGYFESPRQSTATEIANALSLTQSTFSYHLRNAQQTIFVQLFERLQQ